jgi:hypothetical protein
LKLAKDVMPPESQEPSKRRKSEVNGNNIGGTSTSGVSTAGEQGPKKEDPITKDFPYLALMVKIEGQYQSIRVNEDSWGELVRLKRIDNYTVINVISAPLKKGLLSRVWDAMRDK